MYPQTQAAHPLALQLAGGTRFLDARSPLAPAADEAESWAGWLIIPGLALLLYLGWLEPMLALAHVAAIGLGLALGMLEGGRATARGGMLWPAIPL